MSDAGPDTSGSAPAPTLPEATDDELDDDPAEIVDIEPPEIKEGWFTTWNLLKHHRKRKNLSKRGYVRWYLIDGYWPEPKYVKPRLDGHGMPIIDHDDTQYLFPRNAMLASEREGMWTVIHKRGEADPINLREPSKNAIPADALDEFMTMNVMTDPPSFWSKFDVDAQDMVMYAIAGIIVFALINQVLL